MAVLDTRFEDDVLAYLDWENGPTRVREMWDCKQDPCVEVAEMVPDCGELSQHGTRVASVVAAEL